MKGTYIEWRLQFLQMLTIRILSLATARNQANKTYPFDFFRKISEIYFLEPQKSYIFAVQKFRKTIVIIFFLKKND